MLSRMLVQEIQDLKMGGYALGEVIQHLRKRYGAKAPSIPTVRKYYDMDGVPEDLHVKLAKDKAFDRPSFRDAIVEILENNPGCYMSSVYDVLIEKYVDTGEFESLPGNEQTLRNFIRFLKESGTVPEEACAAIYRFLCKIGGRAEELIVDQDSVFVASEEYGEVVETQVFGDFLREQDMGLWVCNKADRNKADSESKGAVENLVKFMKSSYFSARTITSMLQVHDTLPAWAERKNRRVHQTTFKIPSDVFEQVESAALRPLLPSAHEASVSVNL